MSTHPNVILALQLTPDDFPMKTIRKIYADFRSSKVDMDDIKIDGNDYHSLAMEEGYDEDWQLSADPGSILFFDLVTYGYGDTIDWDKLEAQKMSLEAWAKEALVKYNCSQYKIFVTANYW